MNTPMGKLYRHCNWSLIVRITDEGVITEIVQEPPPAETLWWAAVRSAWIDMIQRERVLRDDEWHYFIAIQ